MRKLNHYIICCLIFAQKINLPSIHLSDEVLMTISKGLCCFMTYEFISPKSKYHKPIHMTGYADLCDWCNKGQSKLCQVHRVGLAQLVRFLVVKLTHPGSNPKFDMGVAFTANYFFSGRRRPR
jgi:hypothetical protein